MKNINLKLQVNIQLRETITNNGTEKRDSMIGERYKKKNNHERTISGGATGGLGGFAPPPPKSQKSAKVVIEK